ncbi:MAG: hypothetical protein JSW61_03455 [Candidatus Thorarchaeota archaeon]|nr:MAG: hypothetical protein JSW61_03455 [Candidatus Thorarchaeota archaeon]
MASQRRILRLMRRSHRFLMGHIFSTVFGMYIVMLWVVLVIAMMDLPLEHLSIAFVIIVLPILILPLQYKSAKDKFGALQQAGDALNEIQDTLDERQIASGLTSYIFLIFDVIRPGDTLDDISSKNDAEHLRKNLSDLTRRVITEVIFLGAMYTYLIVNFLIPEFISAIEQGGQLLFPLAFLCVIIAVMVTRWFIFFYWRLLVGRWLKFYQGFIAWGEELERMFTGAAKDNHGRTH